MDEFDLVGWYCEDYLALIERGDDATTKFGLDEFSRWLEARGEAAPGLTRKGFRKLVRDNGHDPDDITA